MLDTVRSVVPASWVTSTTMPLPAATLPGVIAKLVMLLVVEVADPSATGGGPIGGARKMSSPARMSAPARFDLINEDGNCSSIVGSKPSGDGTTA
jgi:hypothetical protein